MVWVTIIRVYLIFRDLISGLQQTSMVGWWGRHFEELYPDYLVTPPEIPPAIQIGSVGNLIFDGTVNNYAFSVANPNQLESIQRNYTRYDDFPIVPMEIS